MVNKLCRIKQTAAIIVLNICYENHGVQSLTIAAATKYIDIEVNSISICKLLTSCNVAQKDKAHASSLFGVNKAHGS